MELTQLICRNSVMSSHQLGDLVARALRSGRFSSSSRHDDLRPQAGVSLPRCRVLTGRPPRSWSVRKKLAAVRRFDSTRTLALRLAHDSPITVQMATAAVGRAPTGGRWLGGTGAGSCLALRRLVEPHRHGRQLGGVGDNDPPADGPSLADGQFAGRETHSGGNPIASECLGERHVKPALALVLSSAPPAGVPAKQAPQRRGRPAPPQASTAASSSGAFARPGLHVGQPATSFSCGQLVTYRDGTPSSKILCHSFCHTPQTLPSVDGMAPNRRRLSIAV